jgi:hypothetical protein
LKISYDDINTRNDPYHLFLDNIKSPDTARKYKRYFAIFQIWFEMRATEDENRIIWKKLQYAKKKGETLDISEFGESRRLRWKNLQN